MPTSVDNGGIMPPAYLGQGCTLHGTNLAGALAVTFDRGGPYETTAYIDTNTPTLISAGLLLQLPVRDLHGRRPDGGGDIEHAHSRELGALRGDVVHPVRNGGRLRPGRGHWNVGGPRRLEHRLLHEPSGGRPLLWR